MTLEIGMLLFPKITQLDLTGPHEVLARMPNARVHVIAKSREPVRAETGLTIVPSTTYADAPPLDLVFVPGGSGQIDATDDAETLAFVRACATRARWMTSACTGSLLLGAAGLLRGYRAATHWAFMDLLPLFGATAVPQRVVVDRDRITGGGVTAGIDIALTIVAELAGRRAAETIELQLEYDPHPPFRSGHPNIAAPDLVAEVRASLAARFAQREAQLRAIPTSTTG